MAAVVNLSVQGMVRSFSTTFFVVLPFPLSVSLAPSSPPQNSLKLFYLSIILLRGGLVCSFSQTVLRKILVIIFRFTNMATSLEPSLEYSDAAF